MANKEQKIYMKEAETALVHTYNRFPLVIDRAEDVYVYDTDGNKYLDFMAGIAVSSLGYANAKFSAALKEQIDSILHTSNLYYNRSIIEAAKKLTRAAQMDRVFFTNSGTEAIEGALKAAKRYAYNRDGHAGHTVIAMEHAFHGRSLGALSITGTKHYRDPFEPLLPGVSFAKYNDFDSVQALVTDQTCAIILETLQGEGGIYPAEPAFLEQIRALCDAKDILLILDEIQCGMGRTGYMFAWQEYGVRPDIMTVAKAIGNGVPVGAFLVTERIAQSSLEPGDHGTTYGGNPFVGRAVSTVLDIYEEEQITAHVQRVGAYLEEQLAGLVCRYDYLTEQRGKGLIRGLETTLPVGEVTNRALKQGLLVISAGTNVIRLVPPLIIEKQHVDEMIEKLTIALAETAAKQTAKE